MDENEILETTEEVTEEVTDSGENDVESADQQEGQEGTPEPEEKPAEEPKIDVNAIAAAARRKSEEQLKSRDAEYARRFGHLKNPITGQPIRSEADYLAALDAQEELKAKEQLKENGVDPAFLDSYIANNPVIRQAQQVLINQQNQQLIGQINAELAEIQKIDPSVKDLNDLSEEVAYVQEKGGYVTLLDAYKILNYGKVSEGKQAAIKQAAINQAKGKQHLAPVNGVSTPDEGVEIPSDVLSIWKETFPDKSNAELKKLYNKTL